MKILMLTSSYPKFRGDVTAPFIESIATHIAARGHTVHVVLPEHRELRRAAVEDGVHFHPYRYAPRREWTVWGYAESLRADVQLKRGVYALAPLVLASSFAMLLQLTAHEHFDALHAHWVLPNAPAAALAARWRHLPLVISLHGSDVFVAEKTRAFGAAARWCFQRADAVTACSDDLLNRALALGAPEARTELVPYGSDIKGFNASREAAASVRKTLGLRADELMVLGIGRLVYKKGFDYLIQAMAQVTARAPYVRLVLAGEGDLRPELEARAHALGLNSHVLFPGKVSRTDAPAYFAAADVVVVPSVRDEAGNVDGLPNVALEALASGRPLVASRVGGLPDVIDDGQNGLLVPEKDPEQLAESIVRLAQDAALRAQLGEAGRAHVRDALNWDTVARRFVGIYERVVKTRENGHVGRRSIL